MKKWIHRITTSKAVVICVYLLLRLYLLSVSVTIINEKDWRTKAENGGRVLLCMFHQQFLSGIRFFTRYRHLLPCIMISQSRDGQIAAWAAETWGARVARGVFLSGR